MGTGYKRLAFRSWVQQESFELLPEETLQAVNELTSCDDQTNESKLLMRFLVNGERFLLTLHNKTCLFLGSLGAFQGFSWHYRILSDPIGSRNFFQLLYSRTHCSVSLHSWPQQIMKMEFWAGVFIPSGSSFISHTRITENKDFVLRPIFVRNSFMKLNRNDEIYR